MENSRYKFRAWNKELKKFFYFKNGRYYSDISCENIFLISERICKEFNWNNAEQYTGLKDKNGKEIYEGDIFEDFYCGERLLLKIVFDEQCAAFRYNIYELIISDESFCEFQYMYEYDYNEMEIIGNIHENPELLEE